MPIPKSSDAVFVIFATSPIFFCYDFRLFCARNLNINVLSFLGLDWVACPIGTYSNTEGGATIEECLPCDPRFYCNGTAQTSPTQLCEPGYYCQLGVKLPNPNPDISGCEIDGGSAYPSIGDVCPPGTFCPEGSEAPQVRPPSNILNRFATNKTDLSIENPFYTLCLVDQIGLGVFNNRHRYYVSLNGAVLPWCNDAEMSPANSLHALPYYNKFNEDSFFFSKPVLDFST